MGNSPGIPVLLEGIGRGRLTLQLPERPLINDRGVTGVVKQTGSNPWLDGVSETWRIFSTQKSVYGPRALAIHPG